MGKVLLNGRAIYNKDESIPHNSSRSYPSMIKFLQSGNKIAKYLLAGFLLIIAASMVLYLIPGFMGDTANAQSGVIATVAGRDVTREDVARVVQAQSRGQQLPDFYTQMLRQQAIKQLIQQNEVYYESERLGFKVSDQEFRDELQFGPYKQIFFPEGKWIGSEKY